MGTNKWEKEQTLLDELASYREAPEMTPKSALDHLERGYGNIGCAKCQEAFSVLRSLVERPTVEDVRWEIETRITNYHENHDHTFNFELVNQLEIIKGYRSLLDFIDRKVPHD